MNRAKRVACLIVAAIAIAGNIISQCLNGFTVSKCIALYGVVMATWLFLMLTRKENS